MLYAVSLLVQPAAMPYERPITTVTFQQAARSHENMASGATDSSQFAPRRKDMKFRIFIAAILLASLAQAKEPKHNQSGTLLQMDSAECGVDENSGKSVIGELVGTDSAHKKTHALLCQEYLMQSDSVIYRIRPRDEKHPVLLSVGQKAQFRIQKDKMLLQVEDGDSKEREYSVVSMTPRQAAKSAENTSPK
jgi:hypothetical protein